MPLLKTDNVAEAGLHVFQRAGLGQAPYKFVGMNANLFPNGDGTHKPGGTCDFCGTGIMYEFHLKSTDVGTSRSGATASTAPETLG